MITEILAKEVPTLNDLQKLNKEKHIKLEKLRISPSTLFIYVGKGHQISQNQWKKIKKALRKWGFQHLGGAHAWHHALKNGKWTKGPYEAIDP